MQGAYNYYKRRWRFCVQASEEYFHPGACAGAAVQSLSGNLGRFFLSQASGCPITDIAEGTRAVAKGNYDMQLPLPRIRDELGFLVASFNDMTRRVAQAGTTPQPASGWWRLNGLS